MNVAAQWAQTLTHLAPAPVTRFGIETYSRLRSFGFTAEFLALQALAGAAGLAKPNSSARQFLDWKLLQEIRLDMESLLSEDARRIAEGVYPVNVLSPEAPWKHATRFRKILFDGLKVALRKRRGRTTEFSERARENLEELPRYYRRNFHFQTDGYLSTASAELYDHQVEILFRGGAGAMRRLLIEPLKQRLGTPDGKGLRFLEIACGTGAATQMMSMAFPKAKIIATDLSEPYLQVARKKVGDTQRVHFLQAEGEKLPFKDGEFDVVYSVFLFHELPLETRRQVIAEQLRVLKPGGWAGAIDSAQPHDVPAYSPLLENFPEEYHEPFYRNYLEHPLEGLFAEGAGSSEAERGRGFFSKWLLQRKG